MISTKQSKTDSYVKETSVTFSMIQKLKIKVYMFALNKNIQLEYRYWNESLQKTSKEP